MAVYKKLIFTNFISVVVGMVAGFSIAGLVVERTIETEGVKEARFFRATFNSVADQAGNPLSAEATSSRAKGLMELSTVRLGQTYNTIPDNHVRKDVVRLMKLVDTSPGLLNPNNPMSSLASAVRRCIVQHGVHAPDKVPLCTAAATSKTFPDDRAAAL
jgi:hypothetical protein